MDYFEKITEAFLHMVLVLINILEFVKNALRII